MGGVVTQKSITETIAGYIQVLTRIENERPPREESSSASIIIIIKWPTRPDQIWPAAD